MGNSQQTHDSNKSKPTGFAYCRKAGSKASDRQWLLIPGKMQAVNSQHERRSKDDKAVYASTACRKVWNSMHSRDSVRSEGTSQARAMWIAL